MEQEQPTKPKCPQCGQPIESPVRREIFRRDRDPYTRRAITRKDVMEFCSAQCGGHYQMGCEG